jgi:hypothetical protein
MPLPESPFDARPAPTASEGSTPSSSSAPSSTSTGPTSAKPIPVEFPLTSFSSTPHNVACIAFVLGACWATGLALSLPNLNSGWFNWSSPLTAASKLPQQGWWTAVTKSPQLGTYLASWAIFHLLEFTVTSMYNPGKLSVQCALLLLPPTATKLTESPFAAYLLDNGNTYHVAHVGGILEHILEERYFPEHWRQYKHSGWLFVFGASSPPSSYESRLMR